MEGTVVATDTAANICWELAKGCFQNFKSYVIKDEYFVKTFKEKLERRYVVLFFCHLLSLPTLPKRKKLAGIVVASANISWEFDKGCFQNFKSYAIKDEDFDKTFKEKLETLNAKRVSAIGEKGEVHFIDYEDDKSLLMIPSPSKTSGVVD
ncbi:glycosyl transferase group 1 [Corchorus olitorius]|uniref:Glycosyl transferase group 1 n=1 Tax=Corchorus olitorius TaxID=93759 RepID=A0A1R3HJ31_9ROSI|nr:glycosyl transferase group 1 [Corchorus olitorius]